MRNIRKPNDNDAIGPSLTSPLSNQSMPSANSISILMWVMELDNFVVTFYTQNIGRNHGKTGSHRDFVNALDPK